MSSQRALIESLLQSLGSKTSSACCRAFRSFWHLGHARNRQRVLNWLRRPGLTNAAFKVFACATLWFWIPQTDAALWSFRFPADLSLQYDDNLNLTTQDEISAYRLRAIPRVLARRETERFRFDMNLSLWIDRYLNTEDQADRNDPRLLAGGEYQFERAALGGKVSYTRRSTLESELEDTGRGNVEESQDTLELSGYGQYELDARNTLRVDGLFRDVSYTTDRLVAYRYGLIGARLTNQWSPRFTVHGAAQVTRYRPDTDRADRVPDTDTYLLGLGGEYAWSESTSLELGIGAVYADQSGVQDTSSWEGNFALSYEGEYTRAKALASRTQQPSSSGRLRMDDRVGLVMTRDLTARSSARIGILWRGSSDLFGNDFFSGDALRFGDHTSRQIAFEPRLEWHWTASLTLHASYTLRRLKRENESEWATSNAVLLGLRYAPLD